MVMACPGNDAEIHQLGDSHVMSKPNRAFIPFSSCSARIGNKQSLLSRSISVANCKSAMMMLIRWCMYALHLESETGGREQITLTDHAYVHLPLLRTPSKAFSWWNVLITPYNHAIFFLSMFGFCYTNFNVRWKYRVQRNFFNRRTGSCSSLTFSSLVGWIIGCEDGGTTNGRRIVEGRFAGQLDLGFSWANDKRIGKDALPS
jgi:hypothetical protein